MPSNDESPSSDWYESPFPLSPSQGAASLDPAMGRGGRSLWMLPIALWLAALAVVAAVVMYFVIAFFVAAWALGNSFNSFGQGLEQGLKAMELGGTTADAAAGVAASVPPGSLSVASLNAALPKYQWADGATSVPYSAKRPIVSVNASGMHVVTAVQADPDFCMYGLSVTSGADHLITENQLPGPGTYFQMEWQAPQCVADQAPASGWQSWPLSLSGG